jgi:hypothetical protein
VTDQAFGRPLTLDAHLQRGDCQLCCLAGCGGPAYVAMGAQVDEGAKFYVGM